jgi:hypothetical protein
MNDAREIYPPGWWGINVEDRLASQRFPGSLVYQRQIEYKRFDVEACRESFARP